MLSHNGANGHNQTGPCLVEFAR